MKLFFGFLLSVSFIHISALDCNNPLLATFGFTASGPGTVTDINYCSKLQAGAPSCCTADDINTIQSKQDDLLAKLQSWSAKRDQLMTSNIKTYANKFQNLIIQLITAAGSLSATNYAYFVNQIWALTNLTIQHQQNIIMYSLNYAYGEIQRQTCFHRMLAIQSAAYCLACDADYLNRGLASDGTLTFSSNLCSKIQTDCFPYHNTSSWRALYVTADRFSLMLNGYINLFNDLNAGTTSLPADPTVLPSNYYSFVVKDVSDAAMGPLTSDCSNSSNPSACNWICSDGAFMTRGVLQLGNLLVGGAISDPGISQSTLTRLLGEEKDEKINEKSERRELAISTWDPDDNEAGTSFNIEVDPGNTIGAWKLTIGNSVMALVMFIGLMLW